MSKFHIYSFFILIYLSSIKRDAIGQIKPYAATYVNLEGTTEVRTFNNGGLAETQYIGQCSGSKMSISKSGELKLSSYANNCYATHNTSAFGSWSAANLTFTGGDTMNIPLNVNFEITGSQDLVTSPGSLCWSSIASSIMSFHATTDQNEIKMLSHLQHQNGFPQYYQSYGFDSTDAWAELSPVIKFGSNAADVIKLEKTWAEKFLRNLFMSSADALTANDAVMDDKMIQYLSGGIPIGDLSGYKVTLTKNEGRLLNAMRYMFSIGVELLPVIPQMVLATNPVKIGFDVKFKHKHMKSVRLQTGKSNFLNIYMSTQANTIPQCETRATTDFSNTAKIVSITVADGYDTHLLADRDLRVHFGDNFSLPITYDVLTKAESENSEGVQVYPNPTSDFINVKFRRPKQVKAVVLLNDSGTRVGGRHIDQVSDIVKLENLPKLQTGKYFVRIFLSDTIITKPIFIK